MNSTRRRNTSFLEVLRRRVEFTQDTSVDFGKRCKEIGVRPSMGSLGDAYVNAMTESFFASLECELIHRRSWKSFAEASMAVLIWIEGWYNPRRRHSGIGQRSAPPPTSKSTTKPTPPCPPPLS